MGVDNISIINSFKKRLILNLIMIIAAMICLGILLFNISGYEYRNRVLVNILGNQRALSQKISKNSTRAFVLLDSIQNNKFPNSTASLKEKLLTTQSELLADKEIFEKVFLSARDGYVLHENKYIYFNKSLSDLREPLGDIEEIWPQFSECIDTIATSGVLNDSVTNATIHINETNEKLLDASNRITKIVVDSAKKTAVYNIAVSIFLVAAAFIIIVTSHFSLYKYLLLPIDTLYKDISVIGIKEKPQSKPKEVFSPMVSEINDVFLKQGKLISLIENINENSSFNDILKFIFHSFSSFIPYNHIGIALIHDEGKSIKAAYGISGETLPGLPQNLIGRKIAIQDTSLNQVIDSGVPRVINDLERYTYGRPLTYYNKVILNAGIRSSITLPLKHNNKAIGMIFFSSKNRNAYSEEHIKFLQTITNSIAIAFQKNIYIEELLYSSILALAKLAESRDLDTGDHLQRMKIYSKVIAQFLHENSSYMDQINLQFIDDIEKFSPLHDIGKVAIRDKILLKPGKLTEEEFEEMKQHTLYGAEVLKAADENISKNGRPVFRLGIEIAEAHHEKWNGTGYPRGIKGEDIPLSARIVAVADVFDALTSRRPYKEPFSLEEAFALIEKDSGRHFDPEIVRVFLYNKHRIIQTYNSFREESAS